MLKCNMAKTFITIQCCIRDPKSRLVIDLAVGTKESDKTKTSTWRGYIMVAKPSSGLIGLTPKGGDSEEPAESSSIGDESGRCRIGVAEVELLEEARARSEALVSRRRFVVSLTF